MFDGDVWWQRRHWSTLFTISIGKKSWQKTYIIYAILLIQTALDLAVLDGLGLIKVFSKNGYSFNNLAKKNQKNWCKLDVKCENWW